MAEVTVLVILIALVGWVLLIKSSGGKQPSAEHRARDQQAQRPVSRTEQIQCFPQVRVHYVVDGDTIIIRNGWSKTKIRLDSIDCPEDGQYWGDTAKYGLIKLIGGRKVQLEEHGIDQHGRTLATIYVWHDQKNTWMNVNERMVTLGHAWVLRRFYEHLPQDRKDKLDDLEKWAKSKKIGLWHEPDPTPPWDWRYERS